MRTSLPHPGSRSEIPSFGFSTTRILRDDVPSAAVAALAPERSLDISVVLAVVSGKDAVRRNLEALIPQINFDRGEVIVPYDKWSMDVGDLAPQFPDVRFHLIRDLGLAARPEVSARGHRLFDRRRAVGLKLSNGRIIALTEDHARPADDWVEQMIKAHEQPFEAIGGAISNGVERPLNRALYYCDFGRFAPPFESAAVAYVSDVNLSYKRSALIATRKLWNNAYHETTVNWALLKRGGTLYLDERPVVHQMRPPLSFFRAVTERVEWGRVFAETRKANMSGTQKFFFAAGTSLLPTILFLRVCRHMRRQAVPFRKMVVTLPIVFVLLCCWSLGECLGYVTRTPTLADTGEEASDESPTF